MEFSHNLYFPSLILYLSVWWDTQKKTGIHNFLYSHYKKTCLVHLQPNFTDFFSLNVLRTKSFANRCTLYFYKVSVGILEQFFFIMGPQTILLTLLRKKKVNGLKNKTLKSINSDGKKCTGLRN